MSQYKFEKEYGKEYLYQISGETVIIRQVDIGSVIFLRVEKEDFSDEDMAKLRNAIGETLMKRAVILPHYVSFLKVSPMIQDFGTDKIRDCVKCGGKMRPLNNGGWMCFTCNNEIPPPITAVHMIGLGEI